MTGLRLATVIGGAGVLGLALLGASAIAFGPSATEGVLPAILFGTSLLCTVGGMAGLIADIRRRGKGWTDMIRPPDGAALHPSALSPTETKLQDMMEAMTDAVYLFGPDERLLHCNSAAWQSMGILGIELTIGETYEQGLRRIIKTGIHALSADQEEAHVARRLAAFRDAPSTDEMRLPSGHAFYVRVLPSRDGGRLLVRTDITAIRRAETEIRAARDRAEEANRAKTSFLANISHELRTPLNAIIGFSEMLEAGYAGRLSGRQSGYVRDIEASGRHLLGIINDVLDIAKIEAGKFELRGQVVDVPELVEACRRMLRERARKGGVEVEVEVPGTLPRINVDELAMRKALINLIANAVKFSPPGSRVRVDAALTASGGMNIAVVDKGIGIAPEDIPKALLPFGQVQSALTRNHEGTGLGLPIAASIVESHGGVLEIRSHPGAGTAVTIRLPSDRVIGA